MPAQFVAKELRPLEGRVSHTPTTSNKIVARHHTTRQYDEEGQGEISNSLRVTRWRGNDCDASGAGGSKVNIHRSTPGDSHHLQARRSVQHSIRYGRAMY